jgi:hypothetical protein
MVFLLFAAPGRDGKLSNRRATRRFRKNRSNFREGKESRFKKDSKIGLEGLKMKLFCGGPFQASGEVSQISFAFTISPLWHAYCQ